MVANASTEAPLRDLDGDVSHHGLPGNGFFSEGNGDLQHNPSDGFAEHTIAWVGDAPPKSWDDMPRQNSDADVLDVEKRAKVNWAEVRGAVNLVWRADFQGVDPGTAESKLIQCEAREKDSAGFVSRPSVGEKQKAIRSILKDSDTNNHVVSAHKPHQKDHKKALFHAGLDLHEEKEKRVRFNLSSSRSKRSAIFKLFRLPSIRLPSDPIVQVWHMTFLLPLTYESWAFPFRLALGSPNRGGVFITDVLCDLWFVLDAVFSCFVAVPEEGELGRIELAYRYVRRTFPFQLLPALVFLIVTAEGIPLGVWWAMGIPRLVPRLLRLRGYFTEMEMNLDFDVDKLQLIKFTLVIFLSCHWVGCAYYWIARVMQFKDNTWVGQFELTMPGVFHREESDIEQHYLALLYRGWIGLAPNSYRKPPQNWPEQLFSVAVMFMAMYLSAYLIGTVLPYIVKKDPVAEEHKKRRGDFLLFANQHQLPHDLVSRVLEYHDFQHAKMSSSAGSLSVQLTRTLEVKVAKKRFGPYIDRCSQRGMVFAKCDSSFIGSLVSKLKEMYMMPGEELIRAGDVARELYFVADGAIQLVEKGEHGAVFKEIRGDVSDMACVVGELSFFLGVPQAYSARASVESDARVLVLTMEDSEKLLSSYPEQQEMILKNVLMEYNLDMHGNDIQAASVEEGKHDDQHDEEQRNAIVSALKRREDEAFAALNFAAAMGDIEEIQRLIRRGCDINAKNYDGRTVLHMACHEGNLRIVELLLENGVEKNVKSRWGVTPLMEAIYAKQHQVVHLLLSHKAEMLLDDPSGVLCDWASRGELDSLKLLLANGVDPNVGDYDSRTPLHLAASEGEDKVVELLISHQADVNVQDRWGGTPLKDAVVSNHAVVASMLRHKKAELPPGIGVAEFCAGASMGDVAKLRMLHACGVNPDEGDYDDRTALHLACAEARLLVVSFLVGVSATINIKDRWGATPLDECVKGGTRYHYFCGKILMGWGAKLGILQNTAQGQRGLDAMVHVDIDEVSHLIRRLIAAGLYDQRQKTCNDQELLVLREASMQLLERGGALLEQVEPVAVDVDRACESLRGVADNLKSSLRAVAAVLDTHPPEFAHAILNRENPDSNSEVVLFHRERSDSPEPGQSHAQPNLAREGIGSRSRQRGLAYNKGRSHPDSQQSTPLRAAERKASIRPNLRFHTDRTSIEEDRRTELEQVNTFIRELKEDELDPNVILKEEVDEPHALLYQELDELVKQQERSQLLGEAGRILTAKNLNRHLMMLWKLEEMLESLEEVFRRFCVSMSPRRRRVSGGDTGSIGSVLHRSTSIGSTSFSSPTYGNAMVDTASVLEVLEALGVDDVEIEDAQQMVEDAEGHHTSHDGRVCASGLLASSELFRMRLYALDGADVGGHEKTFAYLCKCPVLSSLPFACLRRLAEVSQTKHCSKGTVLWRKGRVPSALFVVQHGAFALEGGRDPESRMQEYTEVGSETILGLVEFYTGERLAYSVRATQDAEIIQVTAGQLAVLLQHSPRLVKRMAKAVSEALRAGAGGPVVRPSQWKHAFDVSAPAPEAGVHKVAELITARFHVPVDEVDSFEGSLNGQDAGWRRAPGVLSGLMGSKEDVLLQDLRPGLQLVEESWQLFACGAKAAPPHYFRGVREHLGEVGTRFFTIVYEVIAGKEEVTQDDWWECWLRYLNSTQEMNAKAKDSEESEEDDPHTPHPLRLPGVLQLWQTWWQRSRFRELLLSPSIQERFEAAYLDLKGNTTDSIPVEELPTYLSFLLGIDGIEAYMLHEFLLLFGKKGVKSREVTWFGIRKVLVDRAGRVKVVSEPLFMAESTVFNPVSAPMQCWFYVIRLVAIYHFLFVPVRLVYQPFRSLSDASLQGSDLLADLLVILHVLASFNTSYLNKKSRWVTSRVKIAKKYLASFCYLDVLSAFPLDYILVAFGVDILLASWTRLLKMLFIRVVWSGFAYNRSSPKGLGRLLLMAFMVLHLSACIWSGLGLADGLSFTMGGNTWLHAESSEAFLEGVSRGSELSMWELYTTSLNWVATHTVSAIGNTTLYPKNYVEVLFAMLQLTVGMTFYRMVLGQISTIVMKRDEKIIKVRGQLGSLEGYIEKNKLSDDAGLSNEIRKHFHALQKLQIVDMADVYHNLNHSLQFDMARLLCREALDNAELFRGCSQSMLDRISVMLRQVQFGPEEELFQGGDVPEDMFLVVSGGVDRFTVDSHGEEIGMGGTKAGGVVGDVSFAFGMKHLYGARASAPAGATCLRLARASYLQVLKLYPEDADMVAQNSLNAFERAKVEHGSSKAGSRRGTSVHSADVNDMVLQEIAEDDKSFDSEQLSDSSDGAGSAEFDHMIGSGTAQQIHTLKERQASTRVLQLLQAAFCNDLGKLQKLLSRGVSVNDTDNNKRSALHVACSEGHCDAVRMLLEQGADSTVKDVHGNTPLNDAVRHERDQVCALMRELIPGCHVVFDGSMGAVQMCQAAFEGDIDRVQRLADNGVSVNESDYDQRTALHLAACEGHKLVVQYLLGHGANFNARDRFGGTALQDAVRHEQAEVQTVLREKSKNIVGMDTAMSMCEAAAQGNLHLITTFVQNGVDPNLPDYDKRTALHLAAANGKVEVLNFLLELQPPCNVNPVDVTGGTPLEDAIRHQKEVTRKMLEVAGGLRKGDAALEQCVREQEVTNRRHAREMRRPQVALTVEKSAELRQQADLEALLDRLSGAGRAAKAEQQPASEELHRLLLQRQSSEEAQTGSVPGLLGQLTAALARFSASISKVSAALHKYLPPPPLDHQPPHPRLEAAAVSRKPPADATIRAGSSAADDEVALLPGAVVDAALGRMEVVSETAPALSGHGFKILPELLGETDELIVVLATTYHELPPLPEVCPVLRMFARRYRQSRAALLQQMLYCVSLANRLRQLARQNQDKVHVMDAHVMHREA